MKQQCFSSEAHSDTDRLTATGHTLLSDTAYDTFFPSDALREPPLTQPNQLRQMAAHLESGSAARFLKSSTWRHGTCKCVIMTAIKNCGSPQSLTGVGADRETCDSCTYIPQFSNCVLKKQLFKGLITNYISITVENLGMSRLGHYANIYCGCKKCVDQ